jgi:Cu+-exporting ATPase
MLEISSLGTIKEPLPQDASKGAVQTLTLPIKGMTCAACSTRLERVLGKVPGIVKSQVNLASEQANIDFDPQATPTEQI